MHQSSLVTKALGYSTILLASIGFLPHAALGQGITEIIAQTGDAPPEGNGTFSSFVEPALNNAGQTAFQAFLTGTNGGTADDSGIYRGESSVGTLTVVAREKPSGAIFSGITDLAVPAMNSSGQLAFAATFLKSSNAGGGTLGRVYRGSGGSLTTIASEANAAPNGNGDFSSFTNPTLNASGQAAFLATLNGTSGGASDDSGIFSGSGGAITQIVREGAVAPNGNGDFSGFFEPVLNASGQAAFLATLNGTSGGASDNSGIFRGSGGAVMQIARRGNAAPDGNGDFASFTPPTLNASGQAAFLAFLIGTSGGSSDDRGIFRGAGGAVTQIARRGNAAPDGNGDFEIFNSPALNASGQATFSASFTGTSGGSSDDSGIFRGAGGAVTQIARRGNAAPDGNGDFEIFNSLTLNASGQVAFWAIITGTSGGASDDRGIFLANGIDTIQVAREGQTLAGSTITSLSFNGSTGANGNERSGINDNGQFAYRAILSNGDEAIVRFTIPDVHWTSPSSGSWNTNINWSNSIQPISFHDTFIDPANNLQVFVPAGVFHAKSLTVGGGGGEATLALQAGSQLGILEGPLRILSGSVLSGSGSIDAGLNNQAGGEVIATGGQTLSITGSGSDSFGRITLAGGTLQFTQDFTNRAGGLVIGNGTLRADAGLSNLGTMAFSATTNMVGDVTNGAAGLISTTGGTTSFLDEVNNLGEVRTTAGSFAIFFDSLAGDGNFTGTGTVVVQGDFTPGTSLAEVDFGGDVILGLAAALEIEIGGTTPGSQFDLLDIAGDVSLAGSLDVSILGGFTPSAGNTFEIITATNVLGTFDTHSLPTLFDGLQWFVDYNSTSVTLVTTFTGDFDFDGDVDGTDFLKWQRGESPNPLSASDLADWQANYGTAAISATSAAVPEPTSFALAILSLGLFLRRQRIS